MWWKCEECANNSSSSLLYYTIYVFLTLAKFKHCRSGAIRPLFRHKSWLWVGKFKRLADFHMLGIRRMGSGNRAIEFESPATADDGQTPGVRFGLRQHCTNGQTIRISETITHT
eukprot:scaffold5347_cov130-Cylindrotheca_fusiformis.AAC.5